MARHGLRGRRVPSGRRTVRKVCFDQNSASIGATVTRVLHGIGELPVERDQSVGLELGQGDVLGVKRVRATRVGQRPSMRRSE